MAYNGLPNPEDSGCGEPWQLSPDRGGGRRQRRSPVRHFPEVQLGDTDLTGAKLHRVSDGRHEVDSQRPGLGVDGAAAILPSSGGSSPMDDTQVGPQLRQSLLALSEGPRKPVQLLRMDSTSTNLAASGPSDEHRDSIIAGDSINAGDITTAEGNQIFTINARSYIYGKSEDNYEQVSSQKCDPTGEYGNNHSGEVQGPRQGLEKGTTRCGVREQQLADQEFQDDQEGEGRIQGIPGIPGVPEVAEGKTEAGFGIRELGIEPEEIQLLTKPVNGRRARRVKRIVHQAKTALGTAEQIWTELMNLVSTEPSQVIDIGWQRFETEALDPNHPHRIKNQKAAHKFAGVLGQNPKQIRTVAEVYNPNRFGNRVTKFQLTPGQAFDLTLEHDLLKPEMQAEVYQYLEHMRPGLVVISPPCTLFTPLQNLNKHKKYQVFLKRLRLARRLLKFSAKVAERPCLMVVSFCSSTPSPQLPGWKMSYNNSWRIIA